MFKIKDLLVVTILLIIYSDFAYGINLSKNDHTIVISGNASKVVDFAAKELQFYIEKITGKKLPIRNDNQIIQGKNLILVGLSKYNNLRTNSKVPEAFIIKTHKNNLYLLGDDRDANGVFYCRGKPIRFNHLTSKKGTLFAVYSFLEKYCGIRWFWPGESGMVVPKMADISLPDIDIAEEPDFIIRDPWLECCSKGDWKPIPTIVYGSEYPLWYMRNKLGKGLSGSFAHSWAGYLTNKYFKEHPEYYALIDGKRRSLEVKDGRLEYKVNQVCTSNPDVIRLFVEKIRKRKPTARTLVSISPNDGRGFCECAQCRALDAPDNYAPVLIRNQTVSLSNRIFKYFVNPIAREIKKTHADSGV